jgi:hypothetical protein
MGWDGKEKFRADSVLNRFENCYRLNLALQSVIVPRSRPLYSYCATDLKQMVYMGFNFQLVRIYLCADSTSNLDDFLLKLNSRAMKFD